MYWPEIKGMMDANQLHQLLSVCLDILFKNFPACTM